MSFLSGKQNTVFDLLDCLWETIFESKFEIVDQGDGNKTTIDFEQKFNEITFRGSVNQSMSNTFKEIKTIVKKLKNKPELMEKEIIETIKKNKWSIYVTYSFFVVFLEIKYLSENHGFKLKTKKEIDEVKFIYKTLESIFFKKGAIKDFKKVSLLRLLRIKGLISILTKLEMEEEEDHHHHHQHKCKCCHKKPIVNKEQMEKELTELVVKEIHDFEALFKEFEKDNYFIFWMKSIFYENMTLFNPQYSIDSDRNLYLALKKNKKLLKLYETTDDYSILTIFKQLLISGETSWPFLEKDSAFAKHYLKMELKVNAKKNEISLQDKIKFIHDSLVIENYEVLEMDFLNLNKIEMKNNKEIKEQIENLFSISGSQENCIEEIIKLIKKNPELLSIVSTLAFAEEEKIKKIKLLNNLFSTLIKDTKVSSTYRLIHLLTSTDKTRIEAIKIIESVTSNFSNFVLFLKFESLKEKEYFERCSEALKQYFQEKKGKELFQSIFFDVNK